MKPGIIFDLDGTLWDSTGCVTDIWNRVFDRYPEVELRMTPELSAGLMGKTMTDTMDILFPALPEETKQSIADEFGEEEVAYLSQHGAILYDGVEEALKALQTNYDLFIVSNCQSGYIQAFLQAHGLGRCFKDFEMCGRTGLEKDENIKLILERNAIDRAVYVGDTDGDERATRLAGIPFIWADYGFGKAVAPDAVIHHITELQSCLEETGLLAQTEE